MKQYLIVMLSILVILNLIQYLICGWVVVLATYIGSVIGIGIVIVPTLIIIAIINLLDKN